MFLLVILAIGCRDSHYQKGQIYLREQRWDQAKQEFEAAIAKNSEDYRAYIGLGNVFIAKKDYDPALVYLQKAIEYNSTSIRAYNKIVEVYLIRGQLDFAIQTCDKALEIAPKASTYNLLGTAYFQKRNISKAEEAFKAAINNNPNSLKAQMNLAGLYAQTGKTDLAEQHYRLLLDSHPKNKEAYFKLAQLYASQSQLDKAEEAYRAMQEIDENDLVSRLALGRLYTVQRKYDAAITEYESALEFAPNNINIYIKLVTLYNQVNQFLQAIETGNKLERRLPTDMPDNPSRTQSLRSMQEILYLQQGRAYFGQGDYINAIKYLQRVVDLNTKSAITHYRLGLAHAGIKNYRRAVVEYKQSLKLDSEFIIAHLRLAKAYIALGEYIQAIGECQKFIDLSNPDRVLLSETERAEGYYLSGVAYLVLGKYDESLEQLQQASKLSPDAAEIYVTIGKLYTEQKQFENAIRYYQMVIERDAKVANAHEGLADVYALMGDRDKAIEEYNKTIALSPDSPSTYNNLAWYYTSQEMNLDTALELANKAVSMDSKSPTFRDTLGWVYYKKGMYRQAIPELLTASLGNQNNPLIHYHLGLAYYANDEFNKAQFSLQTALNINANFSEATEAKKRIQQIEN